MEKLSARIPENLESLSKEELISLLKSIKTDESLNKTNDNLVKNEDNSIKTDDNVVENEDNSIKTDGSSLNKNEKSLIKTNGIEENLVETEVNVDAVNKKGSKESRKKKSASFDFCKHKKRHVALKFLYIGWDYGGFAVQTHTDKTIEAQLFLALEKTKLIESRETSNYQRCGRTDKGVSAFSQVISIDLRSNAHEGKGVITPEDYIDSGKREKEIDYPGILNRVLPPEIKVIAWAPADEKFTARFDCVQRTYKYWFPIGELDIKKMLEAGKKLIGEHDFRNFCKMDVANGVINYKRKIFDVDIKQVFISSPDSYSIAELTVVGQAFLYHQIRCIMSILCLIGLGKESIEVIDTMLDIKKCPRKPQYNIASEIPLVLFDCSYEDNLQWNYDEEAMKRVIVHLQNMWSELTVKSVIIKKMLVELEKLPVVTEPIISQAQFLLPGVKPKVYKRLLDRPLCESLEDRIEHYIKKQKIRLPKDPTLLPL